MQNSALLFCHKHLSNLEENVYGEDGIDVICDEKRVKTKDQPIYFLDSRESLLYQCKIAKGTMMQRYLDLFDIDYEISRQIECLNDELLKLEVKLQQKFNMNFKNIVPSLEPILYKDIQKNFLSLEFFENNQLFPLEMMNIEELINDYCKLLKEEVIATQKKTWLWINNPNAFISKEVFPFFMEKLGLIAEETGLLHIFIMSDEFVPLPYTALDIPNTVLLYDDIQQLPSFEVLLESIKRHYPTEKDFIEKLLIQSLFHIFPFIGNHNLESVYLKPQDMILLKVVNSLLGYDEDDISSVSEEKLSELESKYLLS